MNENSLDYCYQINGFHKDIYNIDIQAVTKGHVSYGKRRQIEGRKTAFYTAKGHISEKTHITAIKFIKCRNLHEKERKQLWTSTQR